MPSVKIDGTWREIDPPSVKIDGAWMEMDTGYCKIDGTWHEWDMGPSPIPVTITGTGNAGVAYVVINGETYTSSTSDIEVMPDDTITCYVRGAGSGYPGRVYVGESIVLGVPQNTVGSYKWSVPLCETITINLSAKNIGGLGVGTVKVTTT